MSQDQSFFDENDSNGYSNDGKSAVAWPYTKVTIGILIAIVAGWIGWYLPQAVEPEPVSPSEVAEAFLTAYYSADYDAAKKYGTEYTQSELEKVQDLRKSPGLNNAPPDYRPIQIERETVDGNTARVFYHLQGQVESFFVDLVRINGNWKVEWSKTGTYAVDEETTGWEIPAMAEEINRLTDDDFEYTAGFCNSPNVNLRSHPGIENSAVVGKLAIGQDLTVIDKYDQHEEFAFVRHGADFYQYETTHGRKVPATPVFLASGKVVRVEPELAVNKNSTVISVRLANGERHYGEMSSSELDLRTASTWYKIQTENGETGWVLSDYVGFHK